MNRSPLSAYASSNDSILRMNQVLRNTYLLLGVSFMFSALMAFVAMSINAQPMNPLLLIVGVYGLMFLTSSLRNSPLGLLSVFAFTGFLGYSLGPILNLYIANFSNGPQLIATALGGTGLIFFSLSAYALISRKDFGFLQGFLFVASMVGVLAMLAGIFFQMPFLQLMVSCVFMLVASGMILFQTSEIIHGGETNYIMATITLFVSLYNLFI
ncbi:MAG: Bax inhibitor-1/YccA family protein, partial [Legionellaceae bacterium]|nr:Bax inhibitor-1/YccA family protein [Legionellaceae bacterium]